jgi:hypothetical protein
VADVTIAPGGSASVFVLHEGYVGRDGDDGRVAGTVTRWRRTGRRPQT